MSFNSKLFPRVFRHGVHLRRYATVGSATYVGRPPNPPSGPMVPPSLVSSPSWDARVLANIDGSSPSFPYLVDQYVDKSSKVLDVSLPYESRPTSSRRVTFDDTDDGVFMVSHALRHESEHRVTVCSGFALNISQASEMGDNALIVSCAHTLEEVSVPHSLGLCFIGDGRRCGTLVQCLHWSLASRKVPPQFPPPQVHLSSLEHMTRQDSILSHPSNLLCTRPIYSF